MESIYDLFLRHVFGELVHEVEFLALNFHLFDTQVIVALYVVTVNTPTVVTALRACVIPALNPVSANVPTDRSAGYAVVCAAIETITVESTEPASHMKTGEFVPFETIPFESNVPILCPPAPRSVRRVYPLDDGFPDVLMPDMAAESHERPPATTIEGDPELAFAELSIGDVWLTPVYDWLIPEMSFVADPIVTATV